MGKFFCCRTKFTQPAGAVDQAQIIFNIVFRSLTSKRSSLYTEDLFLFWEINLWLSATSNILSWAAQIYHVGRSSPTPGLEGAKKQ